MYNILMIAMCGNLAEGAYGESSEIWVDQNLPQAAPGSKPSSEAMNSPDSV
jgi:hypothetical protein